MKWTHFTALFTVFFLQANLCSAYICSKADPSTILLVAKKPNGRLGFQYYSYTTEYFNSSRPLTLKNQTSFSEIDIQNEAKTQQDLFNTKFIDTMFYIGGLALGGTALGYVAGTYGALGALVGQTASIGLGASFFGGLGYFYNYFYEQNNSPMSHHRAKTALRLALDPKNQDRSTCTAYIDGSIQDLEKTLLSSLIPVLEKSKHNEDGELKGADVELTQAQREKAKSLSLKQPY